MYFKQDDAKGEEEEMTHKEFLTRIMSMFMHRNGLNPARFQSLRRMEMEVVSMAANLLNGDAETTGTEYLQSVRLKKT